MRLKRACQLVAKDSLGRVRGMPAWRKAQENAGQQRLTGIGTRCS